MPLLVHTVFFWVVGLLVAAELSRGGGSQAATALPLEALLLLCVLALLFRRRSHLVLAGVTTALGLGAGLLHWKHQELCLTRLELAVREASALRVELPLTFLLDQPLVRDGFARGVVQGVEGLSGCRVKGSLRARGPGAGAGSFVRVTGAGRRSRNSLSIEGEVAVTSLRPERWRRMRVGAGATIDRLFDDRAPLVRALLIADQDEISPELRDMYASSGLVHLLSVSGLHVAMIAEAFLVVASAIRLPAAWASVASVFSVVCYVLFLGAPPSAVRSAVMLSAVSLTSLAQRPVHPWAPLALGAAVPTLNPSVVVHLGWQLSVAGMASLVATRELLRKLRYYGTGTRTGPVSVIADRLLRRVRKWRGWRRYLLTEILTGLVATLTTAPIIAWNFGRVSVLAPLTNIVAAPLMSVLQPTLFLAYALAGVGELPDPAQHATIPHGLQPLAILIADASRVPIALLDSVAGVSARLPFAVIAVAPSLAAAMLGGVAALLFVRATAGQRMWPRLVAATGALVLAIWVPVAGAVSEAGNGLRSIRPWGAAGRSANLELHMLDVGQGDALALRTPRGNWVLIDAGRSWQGGDAGRRVVVPYLRRRGGRVAAFILSHAHDDHSGGAASVIEALRPLRWLEPAWISTTPAYAGALKALVREGIPWSRVHPGDSLLIDGVLMRVLGPDSAWTASQVNPNEASVVLLVEYRGVRFLLTGDAESSEERWLLDEWGTALDADVLKLGHHGSRSSSSPEFLEAVDPVLALASVGAANRYGHPSPVTLAELWERGIPVLRTDIEGHVSVSTDGRTLEISTSHERWTIPVKGR